MEAADKGEWWYKPEYAFNAVNINSAMANPQHNSIVYATEDHEVQTVPVNGYVLKTFSPMKGIVSDQSVGAVCCLVDAVNQLCSSIHNCGVPSVLLWFHRFFVPQSKVMGMCDWEKMPAKAKLKTIWLVPFP